MLRYKIETRPDLVALYDIRPGNGAGQFLQPRSPHGAGHHIAHNTCFAVNEVYSCLRLTSSERGCLRWSRSLPRLTQMLKFSALASISAFKLWWLFISSSTPETSLQHHHHLIHSNNPSVLWHCQLGNRRPSSLEAFGGSDLAWISKKNRLVKQKLEVKSLTGWKMNGSYSKVS